jgi:hypothetical protein
MRVTPQVDGIHIVKPSHHDDSTVQELYQVDFKTGSEIRATGIYAVSHPEHKLPAEVTLLYGQVFPPCAKCGHAVHFRLLHAAPDIQGDRRFQITLHSLPAFEDVEPFEESQLA